MTIGHFDPLRYFGFLFIGLCYAGAARKVRLILKADYPKIFYEDLKQPRDLWQFDPWSIKWELKFLAFIMLRKFTRLKNPELSKWGNIAFFLFVTIVIWLACAAVLSTI